MDTEDESMLFFNRVINYPLNEPYGSAAFHGAESIDATNVMFYFYLIKWNSVELK